MQARRKEKQTNLSLTLIYHWINKGRWAGKGEWHWENSTNFPGALRFLRRGFSHPALHLVLFRIQQKLWRQFGFFTAKEKQKKIKTKHRYIIGSGRFRPSVSFKIQQRSHTEILIQFKNICAEIYPKFLARSFTRIALSSTFN